MDAKALPLLTRVDSALLEAICLLLRVEKITSQIEA